VQCSRAVQFSAVRWYAARENSASAVVVPWYAEDSRMMYIPKSMARTRRSRVCTVDGTVRS